MQEVTVGAGAILVAVQQCQRQALEPLYAQQHPEVSRVEDPAALCEETAQTTATGILQSASLAVDAHAHFGRLDLDVKLVE